METDKKVELLESQLKLIKGELKQTLTDVRNFLLEIKLPSPSVTNLPETGGGDESWEWTVKVKAKLSRPRFLWPRFYNIPLI